jgi:hypothetical protein
VRPPFVDIDQNSFYLFMYRRSNVRKIHENLKLGEGSLATMTHVLTTTATVGEEPVSPSKEKKRSLYYRPMLDREPLLSKDQLNADSFQGLVNLGAVIMIAAIIQLCIYNYRHRGLLVDARLGGPNLQLVVP